MNFIVTEYLQQVAVPMKRPHEGEVLIVQWNYRATKHTVSICAAAPFVLLPA
jgi:hypothetical protein